MKLLSTLTDFMHQTSPRASIEQRPEVYETGNRIEVVVPSEWTATQRLVSPSTVALRAEDGQERLVELPAPASTAGASIERHGALTLLRLTRALVPAPALASAQRHVGHSRTVGAY